MPPAAEPEARQRSAEPPSAHQPGKHQLRIDHPIAGLGGGPGRRGGGSGCGAARARLVRNVPAHPIGPLPEDEFESTAGRGGRFAGHRLPTLLPHPGGEAGCTVRTVTDPRYGCPTGRSSSDRARLRPRLRLQPDLMAGPWMSLPPETGSRHSPARPQHPETTAPWTQVRADVFTDLRPPVRPRPPETPVDGRQDHRGQHRTTLPAPRPDQGSGLDHHPHPRRRPRLHQPSRHTYTTSEPTYGVMVRRGRWTVAVYP
jgi:hypothetical protein